MDQDVLQNLEKLISSSPTTISSIDENGYPHTRMMLSARVRDGFKTFYFTTNTSSQKVRHFRSNPKSCLYFADPKKFRGAMFLGQVEVLEDEASKKLVRKDGDEMYYSKGVNDPDYCVLKFVTKKVRWYSDFNPRDFEVE